MTKSHKYFLQAGSLAVFFSLLFGISFCQGTLNINSNPSGEPFTVISTDSSYDITSLTPYSDGAAPANQYTVTWGDVPEYKTPASTTDTLVDSGTLTFTGTYSLNTPYAPTNLTGYTVSSDQIQLNWDNNSNVATNNIIQRNGLDIATVAHDTVQYLDTGLMPGAEYCYTVRAIDSTGDSDTTNLFCLIADGANTPSNLAGIAISDTQVDLSWQDNSGGIDGFILQRQDPLSSFSTIAYFSPNETTYIDLGLIANTVYTYQVLATTDAATSGPSNLSVVTTYGTPVFNFVSNITSGFSPMQVQFTTNLFNNDLESWQWDFGDGNTALVQNPFNIYTSGSNATYTVTAIATNSYGDGTVIKANYITLGLSPTNLIVQATTANVFGMNLQWQDNSNNEIGFYIYREDGIGNGFNYLTTVNANQTNYTDFGSDTTIGLDSTINYIYRVQAFTSDTVSDFTNDGALYAIANFFASPTSAFGSSLDGTLTVNFTDQSLNANSWYWDFGDGIGNSNVQNPGTYMYTATGPTIFYVTESVNNNLGNMLGVASIYTVAIYVGLAPSNLNANAASTTEVDLSWTNNDNNSLGYIIQRQVNGGGFSYLTTVPAGSVNYTDQGLQPITNYDYQIQAFTTETISDLSNIASTQTPNLAYPLAAFAALPVTGFSALTVQFTDESLNTTDTNPSWLWSFGDGNGSGQQNPIHTYTSPTGSNFTVTLILTNVFGTSTTVLPNYIHVGPLGSLGLLPDFKFNNDSAQSNVLNLNNYTTANLTWSAFGGYNIAQASIDSTDEISFAVPVVSNPAIDTINFTSNNSINIASIVKYSTYLMKKLPSVTVDSGTFIENQSISLSSYATPTPSTWPTQPTISTLTTGDNGKISATINGSGTLSLSNSNSKKLLRPVNVIISATPDGSSDKDQEIVRVYEVLNQYGRFTSASDTSAYGFENAPNASAGQPSITWLSSYQGAAGVLRLTYSLQNQGIKFTPFSQYYVPTIPNNWYTVRIRVMCNATTSNNTFNVTLFAYDGVPPAPTEVSGAAYFSVPTTWTWLECPIYTTGATLYPQIVIKNFTTSLRNLYIDDIQVIEKKPDIALAYGETKVQVPTATFSVASDTTLYAFEPPPSGVISTTAFAITNGALDVTISGTTANGVKLTPIAGPSKTLTSPVTVGNGAGASCEVTTSGSLTNPLVLISLYGTSSANSQTIKQLGAFADIFTVPGSGSNYTVTAAFPSLYPYIYQQIAVRSTGEGHFYLNDFYPLVDSDSLNYWDHSLLP